MIALQCFYTLPLADDSETALMLAAAGSVPELSSQPGTLPYWMYKAPGLQEALKLLSRTVSSARVRSAVEPFSLARSLNQCRTRMLPERAAEELRQMGQSREAFNLLHDAMLVQTTHELALLAGEIALHDLNDPLEAIDILEKAIERDHHRVAAYVHQFEAISKLTRLLNEFRLLEQAPSARERMDDLIWRDFNRMDADQQRDNEVAMSRYFLFRRQYEAAAHFIFPRLRMGATHMWWKFDLNLNYVRALAGQQRIAEASALLRYVAGKLDFARQGKTLAHHEITRLDADVRELADQLSVEL